MVGSITAPGIGTILGGIGGAIAGLGIPASIRRRREEVAQKAVQILKQKDVKQHLCPALESVAEDAFEIAKTLTQVLVPLVLTKAISVPLDSLLFALMAVTIAKMGVASFCADYNGKR
jgi:hypothetical protein